MVNKVFVLGNLGSTPELTNTKNGTPVANLSIATNEYKKEGEHVEWHRVVTFGKTAENCSKYLTKGKPVFIEGKLRTRTWETETGDKRYMTEIIADRVQFLGSNTATETTATEETATEVRDDDIPF